MQCQRCHFENIPGQQRCFKCGSILTEEMTILDIHPPRMAKWKRPWRRLARYNPMNRRPKEPTLEKSTSPFIEDPGLAIGSFILSLIPGLAHARQGRFRKCRLLVLCWIIDIIIALFLFPSTWGWIALITSAALHSWLALNAGTLHQLSEAKERMIAVFFGFIIMTGLYAVLALNIPPGIDYQQTPIAVPGQNIEQGDMLRFKSYDPNQPLTRGTLVLFHANAIDSRETDRGIGQIIGLPNDVVSIKQEEYYVNGHLLPKRDFPVPGWIRIAGESIKLGSHHYFISSNYRLQQHGRRQLQIRDIRALCLVKPEDIYGQATMLWNPITRRHHLNSDPNQ